MIRLADSQELLLKLRATLLEDVHPELSRDFIFVLPHWVPVDKTKPMSEAYRLHEISRLKAQLREKINAKRSEFHSQYLQNEEALKMKTQLARWILLPQEKRPANLDFSLLENYANVRSILMEDAAKAILVLVKNAGRVLLETEMKKDELLSRIEQVRGIQDVEEVARDLGLLC